MRNISNIKDKQYFGLRDAQESEIQMPKTSVFKDITCGKAVSEAADLGKIWMDLEHIKQQLHSKDHIDVTYMLEVAMAALIGTIIEECQRPPLKRTEIKSGKHKLN